MNVTLRQLRAFVALTRSGSFTAAAESLHVTQSALSGLVKELEQGLGVRLVDRSTRRVALTEIGQGFYPLVEKILQDLDGALHRIEDLKTLQGGVVRIAAPQLIACTLLPEVIAAWHAAHPAVQIRLADCAVESVLARVASGEVDFGIGPERPAAPEIRAETLFEMPFMLVFPRRHALERRKRITWDDAMRHPFIALQGQFTERLALDLHAAVRAPGLHPSNEVAFMTTALSMVRAGLGVTACLPYAASLVKLYKLQMRLLHDPEVRRKFLLYTRDSASLSPAASAFAAFLFDFVRDHDWSASAAWAE
ncbi:MAG: LysR substrate-binding domain-containing protein [Burkholderiaceae bacterium]